MKILLTSWGLKRPEWYPARWLTTCVVEVNGVYHTPICEAWCWNIHQHLPEQNHPFTQVNIPAPRSIWDRISFDECWGQVTCQIERRNTCRLGEENPVLVLYQLRAETAYYYLISWREHGDTIHPHTLTLWVHWKGNPLPPKSDGLFSGPEATGGNR